MLSRSKLHLVKFRRRFQWIISRGSSRTTFNGRLIIGKGDGGWSQGVGWSQGGAQGLRPWGWSRGSCIVVPLTKISVEERFIPIRTNRFKDLNFNWFWRKTVKITRERTSPKGTTSATTIPIGRSNQPIRKLRFSQRVSLFSLLNHLKSDGEKRRLLLHFKLSKIKF